MDETRNNFGRRQYDEICKPRLDKMEATLDKTNELVHQIHSVVNNGLKEKTKENNNRIKSLDNRLWLLLTGVVLGIITQIVIGLIKNISI
jgi:hypothetical protein